MLDVVRKHRAPDGALRRVLLCSALGETLSRVRKYRAPKGALKRGRALPRERDRLGSQKAPSTERCIKTT